MLLKRCILPAATVVQYVLCVDFGFLIFVLDIPEGEPKMLQISFKEQGLNREKLTKLVNQTISLLDPKLTVKENRRMKQKPNRTWLFSTNFSSSL